MLCSALSLEYLPQGEGDRRSDIGSGLMSRRATSSTTAVRKSTSTASSKHSGTLECRSSCVMPHVLS